jgi:hypothetical protein
MTLPAESLARRVDQAQLVFLDEGRWCRRRGLRRGVGARTRVLGAQHGLLGAIARLGRRRLRRRRRLVRGRVSWAMAALLVSAE